MLAWNKMCNSLMGEWHTDKMTYIKCVFFFFFFFFWLPTEDIFHHFKAQLSPDTEDLTFTLCMFLAFSTTETVKAHSCAVLYDEHAPGKNLIKQALTVWPVYIWRSLKGLENHLFYRWLDFTLNALDPLICFILWCRLSFCTLMSCPCWLWRYKEGVTHCAV